MDTSALVGWQIIIILWLIYSIHPPPKNSFKLGPPLLLVLLPFLAVLQLGVGSATQGKGGLNLGFDVPALVDAASFLCDVLVFCAFGQISGGGEGAAGAARVCWRRSVLACVCGQSFFHPRICSVQVQTCAFLLTIILTATTHARMRALKLHTSTRASRGDVIQEFACLRDAAPEI